LLTVSRLLHCRSALLRKRVCLLPTPAPYPSQYEREAALRDFSSGTVRVLIATDVASRGLDVKGIGHVINMDLPRAFEDYVHRIGEFSQRQMQGARQRAGGPQL
jgi:ATP-dependent helicase YprA (DUF1998 family)